MREVPILFLCSMMYEEEVQCGPSPDPVRFVMRLVEADTGVVERNQMKVMQVSEDKYRLLFESSPQAMWVCDLATKAFLEVNETAVVRYGYSREEFLGMTTTDICACEESTAPLDHMSDQPGRTFAAGICKQTKKDGTVIDVEITSRKIEFSGRSAELVLASDITERRHVEQELAKKTTELEQRAHLLDLAQVLVRDANGTIIRWNPGAEAFYGWTREEAVGKSPYELLQTEFPEPLEEIEAEILREGHWDGELTHTRRDGTRVTVASHQVLQRNERGEPLAILEVDNDITERKEAERALAQHVLKLSASEEALRLKNEELKTTTEQLWQAAKLATVGELAASIAHELNNPLATVSLRLDSLLAQTHEDDPRHRPLSIVEQEIERMGKLVANLLQFSRRRQRQPSTLDVRKEIANTLELVHSHLHNRNINVTLEFAPDVQMVQADRQQLRQVFLNLLTNATDAMPEGGTLTIGVASSMLDGNIPAVTIQFTDTGVGIAEEDLPKVTEPFFTTKPEGKGTGLGLPICKRIVLEHDGKCEITSKAGRGTTVLIKLPVSASALERGVTDVKDHKALLAGR
jgi:two-component system, LuxR family, sensor kinase FixL